MNVQLLNIELIDIADSEVLAARCQGQNAKKTLLVFQVSDNEEELRSFLSKVLAAAQLDLVKDVLSLSVTPDEKISFSGLCQHFDIQTLIAFGLSPEQMGIHFKINLYDMLSYNGQKYVFADDLTAIYEERQQGGKRMSSELWKVLQNLFLK